MGFRDDNEALRARAKTAEDRARRAEEEKARLRRELGAARADDAADAKRIAELEKRLAKLEPRKPTAGRSSIHKTVPLALGLSVAGVALGAVAYTSLVIRPEAARPALRSPAPVTAEEKPAPPPPLEVEPLERVRLAGVVRTAEGVEGVEAGIGCVLDRALGQVGFETLAIRCGDAVVFDGGVSTEAGITNVAGDVEEVTTAEGSVARSMRYTLTGQWSGPQAQIELAPGRRAARVWRSGVDARDVLIHIETSAAHPGKPTRHGTTAGGPIARGSAARLVLDSEVPAALADLDTDHCALRTEPAPRAGTHTVRLEVRCGAQVLYGAGTTGWNAASADGATLGPVEDPSMTDSDGDPAMTFTGERITVADPEWRVAFRVEPHPDCSLAGSWRGSLREADGTLVRGLRLEDGVLTLPGGETLSGEPDMRCHQGVARWVDDAGEPVLDGRFGPEFAVFLGHLADGRLIELFPVP